LKTIHNTINIDRQRSTKINNTINNDRQQSTKTA
jgi:hypothetical protein